MSSKSKTLSAVGYASADIFLQVIRENMTPKMVAEAQELSKNTDGLALVYTISREDIDGAGVWREEKVYQYRNSYDRQRRRAHSVAYCYSGWLPAGLWLFAHDCAREPFLQNNSFQTAYR